MKLCYEGNPSGIDIRNEALYQAVKDGTLTFTGQYHVGHKTCELTGKDDIMPAIYEDANGEQRYLASEISEAIEAGIYWDDAPKQEAPAKEAAREDEKEAAQEAQEAKPAQKAPKAGASAEAEGKEAKEAKETKEAGEPKTKIGMGRKKYKSSDRDIYQEMTDKIVDLMQSGKLLWNKGWDKKTAGEIAHTPVNGASGYAYTGANKVFLSLLMNASGTEDPRFFTMGALKGQNKAHAAKVAAHKADGKDYNKELEWEYRVKKGVRSIAIHQSFKVDTDKQGNLLPVEDQYWGKRLTNVYHAADCIRREYERDKDGKPVFGEDGKPKYTDHPLRPWKPKTKGYTHEEQSEICEAMLKASGAKIEHDVPRLHDSPCYAPASDTIHLPAKESFKDVNEYYATALHELCHWTAHESRMNRAIGSTDRKSKEYAREELRAELASTFLSADLGIPMNPTNHAAYLQHWVTILQEDKKEIVHASQDAKKIADFVKKFIPARFQAQKASLVAAPAGVIVEAEGQVPAPQPAKAGKAQDAKEGARPVETASEAKTKKPLIPVDDPSLAALPSEAKAKGTAKLYRYLTVRPAGPGAIPQDGLVHIERGPSDALRQGADAVYYEKQLQASEAARYELVPDYRYFANKSVHIEVWRQKEDAMLEANTPHFLERDYEKVFDGNFVRDGSAQKMCALACEHLQESGKGALPAGSLIEVDGQMWSVGKAGFTRMMLTHYEKDFVITPLESGEVKAMVEAAKKTVPEDVYGAYRRKFRENAYIGSLEDGTLAVHPGAFHMTDDPKEGVRLELQKEYARDFRRRTRKEGLSIYTPADEKGWQRLDEDFAARAMIDAFSKEYENPVIGEAFRDDVYKEVAKAIDENSPYKAVTGERDYGELCMVNAASREDVEAAYKAFADKQKEATAARAEAAEEREEGRAR